MARKKTTNSEANGVLAADLAATPVTTTTDNVVREGAVTGDALAEMKSMSIDTGKNWSPRLTA